MTVLYPEVLGDSGLLHGRVDQANRSIGYALSGELDLESAERLQARLLDLSTGTARDLVLDLAELDFLGSTGIRALLSVQAELAKDGRRLVLLNVSGAPYRVLEMTGLLPELNLG